MMERKTIRDFFSENRHSFLVFLLYALVASVIFSDLAKNMGHSLIPGDGVFTYWVLNWNIHSFLTDPPNIFNANIFFPAPNTLSYSEEFFVPALIALPLQFVFRNMIFTNNFLILFSYALSAFAMFRLAEYYTKNKYASFVAGLIFGFSTFKLANIVHFQSLMTFWMPFAVLSLQKYLDTKKCKRLIYFALLFSAQTLSSWNMGAFLALFAAFLLAANWKIIRGNFSSAAKDGLIALAVVVFLVAPFAYPHLKLFAQTEHSYPMTEIVGGSADIGGYILPSPGSMPAKITKSLGIVKKHWGENANFIGYFSILALLYYFLFSKNKIISRNFKIYIWGIPIFIILSFGPILRFVPNMRIPSLYYLIVPFTGFIRTPSRLAIIVMFCVSIAAAYVISSVKMKNVRARNILAVLIPVFVLLEFWIPQSFSLFSQTSCPPIYAEVKNSTSVSALVEFPIEDLGEITHKNTLHYMFNSTCHFKPIFNGYSGYAPRKYTKNANKINKFPDTKSLESMKKIGISHIVLHLDLFPAEKQKALPEEIRNEKNLEIISQDGNDYLIKIN